MVRFSSGSSQNCAHQSASSRIVAKTPSERRNLFLDDVLARGCSGTQIRARRWILNLDRKTDILSCAYSFCQEKHTNSRRRETDGRRYAQIFLDTVPEELLPLR